MPRQRGESRVLGPTYVPSRAAAGRAPWRLMVIEVRDGEAESRRAAWFDTEQEAEDTRADLVGRLVALRRTTIAQAIDQYRDHLVEKGTGEVSYKETRRRLLAFFAKSDVLVARVTPELAEKLYVAFRQGRSVAYHRAALINARSMFKWAMRAGLIAANPFAEVEGVGKRARGKLQWTGDEARRFYAHALPLAEAGDRNALACLMALLMGLRSADLCRRVVRDVDLGGAVLRVERGKTERSNRPRHVPEALRPMLVELAAGRPAFEPLFKTPHTRSGHHTRRWLEQALDKLCAAAGVPRVVPHALKGTAGTILATTGELSERIADHLSHEDSSTTEAHYVARGALEDAKTRRGLSVITGGRK